MRRTLSLIVVGLLVTGGTVIGFEVGGRVGFHEGYYIAHRSIEVTNALLALGSLKALEKGDSEGARELLEGLLDVPMFTEWADVRLPSPRHPRFGPSGCKRRALRTAPCIGRAEAVGRLPRTSTWPQRAASGRS